MPKTGRRPDDEQISRGIYRLLGAPELGKSARSAASASAPVRLVRQRLDPAAGGRRAAAPRRARHSPPRSTAPRRSSSSARRPVGRSMDRCTPRQLRGVHMWSRFCRRRRPIGGRHRLDTLLPRSWWRPGCRPTGLILGTDGFGRSDAREALRAAVRDRPAAHRRRGHGWPGARGQIDGKEAAAAMRELGIDPEGAGPALSLGRGAGLEPRNSLRPVVARGRGGIAVLRRGLRAGLPQLDDDGPVAFTRVVGPCLICQSDAAASACDREATAAA